MVTRFYGFGEGHKKGIFGKSQNSRCSCMDLLGDHTRCSCTRRRTDLPQEEHPKMLPISKNKKSPKIPPKILKKINFRFKEDGTRWHEIDLWITSPCPVT